MDMLKRLAKSGTRYLGMSPRGEIAGPHGRFNFTVERKFRYSSHSIFNISLGPDVCF